MTVRSNERFAQYTSRRKLRRGESNLVIEKGDPLISQSERDIFLTARFRLYANWFGRLVMARAEHPRWPLHEARLLRCDETLVAEAGLPAPAGEPVTHFAPRVDVRTGPPESVE
jgi:hypothetical protein